jgi:fumarate reductase subunit D
MAHKKSIEPLLWTLFSAGGVVAALTVPAHLLLFGVVLPLAGGGPNYDYMTWLLNCRLTQLYLFVVCSLGLWHAAHRLRFTLYDGLQIKHLNELIAAFCYGGAAVGTVTAAYLLFSIS